MFMTTDQMQAFASQALAKGVTAETFVFDELRWENSSDTRNGARSIQNFMDEMGCTLPVASLAPHRAGASAA